jgi:hypothetical protein
MEEAGVKRRFGPTCNPARDGCSAVTDQASGKKILDRILKPGKLTGNVGNYEGDAEPIST